MGNNWEDISFQVVSEHSLDSGQLVDERPSQVVFIVSKDNANSIDSKGSGVQELLLEPLLNQSGDGLIVLVVNDPRSIDNSNGEWKDGIVDYVGS